MLNREENVTSDLFDDEQKRKLVQEMNLMDDDFFQKTMEDIDSCEELIQTILQDESLHIIEADTQKFLRNCGSRSVQLDLLCRSSNNRYLNVEVQKSDKDDGTKIAKLMQYMMDTQGECEDFLKLSKRVKYFKEEQEGVRNMCEAVEQYARERAERVMEESVKKFFMNGAGIELVAASITELSKERIQQIYDEVMSERLKKV